MFSLEVFVFVYYIAPACRESDVYSCTAIVIFLIVEAEYQASAFLLRRPAVSRLTTRVAGTCGGVAISLVTTRNHLLQRHARL